MPQLWLTYQELADELGCHPDQARMVAIARRWTRKRSSDGLTRAKMPGDLMLAYFVSAAARGERMCRETDALVAQLRGVFAAPPPVTPALRLRSAS